MAPPVYTVGQVLAAADCNNWFVPLVAVKTADQSVTSSVTLVNDTELFVSLAASVTYAFQMMLDYEGGTAGASDLKWTFGIPAGTFMRYCYSNRGTGLGASVTMSTGSSTDLGGTNGAGNLEGVHGFGTIVCGSTAGTLQLKWAQNTSSATSTIMHAQSCLMLWRIS